MLRCANSDLLPVHCGILDLEKAFDSVSHAAIFEGLDHAGVHPWLVDYIRFIYRSSRTFLQFKQVSSDPIHLTRGVRQGDPLSPLLFNLVFNKMLSSVPPEEGFVLGSRVINRISSFHL